MLFINQLVSFPLILLIQNPLVSGWTNKQYKCLLNLCFKNQIDIHKTYHVFSKCSMSWLYTNLSIILIILAVMKQVYSFQAQCFYLFLSRGFTLAILHTRGNLELKKRLIISHNCSVNNSTPSFKNLPGIPSIPYVLLRSISISIL